MSDLKPCPVKGCNGKGVECAQSPPRMAHCEYHDCLMGRENAVDVDAWEAILRPSDDVIEYTRGPASGPTPETDIGLAVMHGEKTKVLFSGSRREARGRSGLFQVGCPCCQESLIVHILVTDKVETEEG